MRSLGRTTSKKFSLIQSWESGKASMRWHAPTINYPKQKRFCKTKEDFHEEYGLSMEGENPRCLSDADVPENQWVTVFTHKHVNNEKIHLKSVRPEFYEECALLYHKVYQRIPPNNEITVKFARGFAFEKYKLTESPTKKPNHKVAWAVFAESVIKNVTVQKNLQTKMALWRKKNSPVDDSTIITQDSLDAAPGGDCSQAAHPCTQYDRLQVLQPACLVHTELVVDMVIAAKKNLQEKESSVVDCRASIDEAKTKRDKAKGVRGAAEALLQKINRSKEELQVLEGEGDEGSILRLRAEIMGCQVALDLLGPDVCSSTLDKAVDELQCRHSWLLKEVEEANTQFCFVNNLFKQVETRQVPTLALAPPSAWRTVKGTLLIQENCAACGFSIEHSDVVGVYMLPCRHPYHPICFATLCYTRKECMRIGCSQSIPNTARQIVLGCHVEQSKLKDAPCEVKAVMRPAKTPSSRKHNQSQALIGSSCIPVLQPEPLSTVPITMDGASLLTTDSKIEGNTLNSHREGEAGENLKGENASVEMRFERTNYAKEPLCIGKECCSANLSVAAAMAEGNRNENVLQCADATHSEDHDTQHTTLNQVAHVGTKKRKGTQKKKASKKHKNRMPANMVAPS